MNTVNQQIEELQQLMNKAKAKKPSATPTPAQLAAHRLATAKAHKVLAEIKATRLARSTGAQAAANPVKVVTAADFSGERLRMTREEFRKLSAADKARFLKDGGTIA